MKNIMPTQFIGFDIDAVETWDFHPETDESKGLGLSFPMLEIFFKSGKKRTLYKKAAEITFELLCDTALKIYGDEQ